MNAPAETAPANTDYLKVLEALVQINEPAERERIARRADISPDGAGVQLVALAGKRIVVRCPQPKGAPALWSLAVPLSTVRQMVDGMKRAAAEAGPGADDRRRIIAAMREIGAPASAFGIAKKSGVEMSNFSLFLEEMAADGVIQRIGGTSGQRPKFALIPSVQSQTPAATDGEPGDGTPAPEPDDTQAVDAVEAAPDPDGWIPWNGGDCPVPEGGTCWVRLRDGSVVFADKPLNLAWGRCDILASPERRAVALDEPLNPVWVRRNHPRDIVAYRLDTPAHLITPAYSAAVTAESAADAAPLTGTDVCSADAVIADWKREHTPAVPTIAPADAFAVWLADTKAGCAGQRAIDAAEQEAARLKAEAAEMVREAAEALEFGTVVAEIIRFADQRNVSTSTADVEFGLAELLAAAYEAVTGKRVA